MCAIVLAGYVQHRITRCGSGEASLYSPPSLGQGPQEDFKLLVIFNHTDLQMTRPRHVRLALVKRG